VSKRIASSTYMDHVLQHLPVADMHKTSTTLGFRHCTGKFFATLAKCPFNIAVSAKVLSF